MNHISKVVAAVIASFVVSAIFFAISAYNDFPASNQNMHALHASVLSGFTPDLSQDWLYKTTDPFPLATSLTAIFLKFGPAGVYFLYFMVIVAFVLAFIVFLDSPKSGKGGLVSYLWSGLVVLSALVLGRLTGLSAGVANQLILSSMWQPSEGGVILLISVLLFASGWPVSSAVCAALAVALYPGIALGALILVTAACLRLVVEREWRELFIFGGVFTVLVSPTLVCTAIEFMPTTNDLAGTASHILVREKIPFHAMPAQWINRLDILRIAIVAFVIYIFWSRNKRLSSILLISIIVSTATTLIFYLLDDDLLLLLFPWRVSVVLAPIALILIVWAGFNSLSNKLLNIIYNNRKWIFFGIVTLSSLVQFMKIYYNYPGFIPEYWFEATFMDNAYDRKVEDKLERLDVINWAKNQGQVTDLYLVPLDFEQFRIKSGRPIFVDWKSHPFKDIEVIEWKRRIDVANKTFESLRECKKIDNNEFNIVILDNSSLFYKIGASCRLYAEKQINSRFGFVKLK